MAISDSRADTPQHKPSRHSRRSLAASWLTRERQPALAGLVMCRGRYARSDGSQGRLDGVTGKGPAQEPVLWAVIWGHSDGQGWGPWLTISHPVGSCFHRVLHRTYSHSYPQAMRDSSQLEQLVGHRLYGGIFLLAQVQEETQSLTTVRSASACALPRRPKSPKFTHFSGKLTGYRGFRRQGQM